MRFEAYVAGPLAEFVLRSNQRERIWIAERAAAGDSAKAIAGCIAIVEASQREAQLRWFLVAPPARGQGLGTRLLREAVAFCRESGYESVFLFTVSPLAPAARLYRAVGFDLVHEQPARLWGMDVLEQRHELRLKDPGAYA